MSPAPVALSKPQPGQPCPCGSGKLFDACCEPLLAARRSAATAEELMRSRFTAHVAGDFRHLHRTYLATAKLPYIEEPAGQPLQWTRLVIHSHEPGKDPNTAFVEFTAFHVESGVEHPLQERSEFQRVDGSWIYARTVRHGPAPFKSAHPKVGRNDPCPCGSGKKYKQCCLGKA